MEGRQIQAAPVDGRRSRVAGTRTTRPATRRQEGRAASVPRDGLSHSPGLRCVQSRPGRHTQAGHGEPAPGPAPTVPHHEAPLFATILTGGAEEGFVISSRSVLLLPWATGDVTGSMVVVVVFVLIDTSIVVRRAVVRQHSHRPSLANTIID